MNLKDKRAVANPLLCHVMGELPTPMGKIMFAHDPDEYFKSKLRYARGTAKVDLAMNKIAERTRRPYKTARKHRRIYRRDREGIAGWIYRRPCGMKMY